MKLVLITLLLAPAAPPEQVVWVDVKRAILGTPDGRAAKAKLKRKHELFQREIRGKEQRLIHERQKFDPSRYDEEVEKIQKEVRQRQEALEKEQQALLEPIVKKMEGLLEAQNARPGGPHVLDVTKQPLVAPPDKCDLTSWLIRAYAAPRIGAPKPTFPCRFEAFVYVDFDRALAGSAAGKAATKKLDAKKAEAQADIDRRQRELREMKASAEMSRPAVKQEYEQRRRALAQRFARYQADLRKEEIRTEGALYEKLESAIGKMAKGLPKVLFIEHLEGQKEKLDPRCDATEWAATAVDGKASVASLVEACPVVKR